MRKIISLLISGMLMLGIVGCGSEKCKVLQNEIDIFESINEQKIEKCCMEDYCNSIEIEGLYVDYSERNYSEDYVGFTIIIEDEELYNNFKEYSEEVGVEKAREKYGVDELIRTIIKTNKKQQKIVSDMQEKDIDIYCNVLIYNDSNTLDSVIVVCNENVITDEFK